MADRGFNGYDHWRAAQATGAHLLWRCAANRVLPRQQALADGSYLSVIMPTGVTKAQAREQAAVVRVIEYALPHRADSQPGYRW